MKVFWIKAQAPRRVLALLKHLGVKAELVEADARAGALRRADYARLNPNMKAPTLVDGELVLWESSAIMAHICIKAGSDMWPTSNPAEQVEVLRWLSWSDCHWSPQVAPFYFEHIAKATFGIGSPDKELLKSKVIGLQRMAQILDAHLHDRTHVACARLTIVDFHLASMACDWRAADMPLGPFPSIVRWLDALMRNPAWADPWPPASSAPA